MVELINKIHFFVIPVSAVFPLFLPLWKKFIAGSLLFLVLLGLFIILVSVELSDPAIGDGPEVFGVAIYVCLNLALFILSCLMKTLFNIKISIKKDSHTSTNPSGSTN